jgi:hypothetical protein
MPAAQTPAEHDPFRFDRFPPAIHEVETENYKRRTGEIRDDLSRMLAQSTFWTIKYGLIDAERELDRISNMEPDWDSYGAEPPSDKAIRATRETLKELVGDLLLPSAIVPSAEGGVSIYFMSGNRTAYIETYNQGSQALVMYDQQGNTEVLELGNDINRVAVGRRILAYLG